MHIEFHFAKNPALEPGPQELGSSGTVEQPKGVLRKQLSQGICVQYQLNSEGQAAGVLHLINLHHSNILCYSFSTGNSHVLKMYFFFGPNCLNVHCVSFLGLPKQMTTNWVV